MWSELRYSRPVRTGLFITIILALSLTLAACSNDTPPTNVPQPTATTISTTYRVEKDTDLFFQGSVLSDWQKRTNAANSVIYAPLALPNTQLTISTSKITRLQANSTALSDKYINDLRQQYGNVQLGASQILKMVDREVTVNEVQYNNGQDITEYVTQVNVSKADRAYLLIGALSTADSSRLKSPILQMMSSLSFNPPDALLDPRLTPTIPTTPIINSGKLQPTPGSASSSGKKVGLLDWTSPALNSGKTPTITFSGKFPVNWNWGIKPFPTENDIGLFLVSNITAAKGPVGQSSAEANIQLGLVQNVFAAEGTPKPSEWENGIKPVMDYFQSVTLPGIGSNVQVDLPVADINGTKKVTFTVRSDGGGQVNSLGSIYFRNVGKNMLVGILYISPDVAFKDAEAQNYDTDMLTIMNNVRVNIK
ncbi:hypothetical protein [Candidatus Chlorohelix sp.]|uniref:hypothetical protein n=1 Tax=Candidatus Chlorohelix sp. TaxID=3139201 RepID=UPI0030628DD0